MARLLQVATLSLTLRGFLLPFVSHFRAKGWRVDALAHGARGCSECKEAFDNVWDVDWSRNPLDPRNLSRAIYQVRAVVRSEKYDLIHVHTPVAAFIARYALRGLRRKGELKVIYTAHGFHFYRGGHPLQNAIFLGLEKLAGRWTDYLVVINREDEEAAHRYRIVPSERVYYMPGIGVDTDRYSPDTVSKSQVARFRRELRLDANVRLFLMVAEFNHRKRHRDLLQAFALINRPDVHLTFAGVGPLMDEMKKLVSSLGLKSRVHFLGFRDDVPALTRASVATILPSKQEGLPRSVMESLSLEVPVIGTDIRGVRDLLKDGEGILVKVGDIEGLAQAMTFVLEHPDRIRRMGQIGRKKMEAFDLSSIIQLHERLYYEALNI
jgi:glycosyltransferase involved in cell wall biosynthesis